MKQYHHQFLSMGCPCEIGVFSADPETAQLAITDAENEVRRLDRKYSHFHNNNFISRLQISAQQSGGVNVDTETSALLDYAAIQFKLSKGMFDITAGCLARLWHQRKHLPSPVNLNEALQHTGWTKLQWHNQHLTMPAGMQLELGGLVKEYAADRAALLLKRKNMRSAFVELGGDIHVTGPRPDGKPWNMGITKPDYQHSNKNKAIANIPITTGGLATSGDYERSSLINGKRYGHIINPKTGWPVNSFQSVSVVAPSCLLAGSISTLAMLMGQEAGLKILQNSGLAWLAQTPDGVIHTKAGETGGPESAFIAHHAVNGEPASPIHHQSEGRCRHQ